MSINHHPDEALLAAYAGGTLDLGQHVAVATHLTACPHCREWVRSMERVGGALLADLQPAALSQHALVRVLDRLDEPGPAPAYARREGSEAPAQLPRFVKTYQFGGWRMVAPGVRLRPILLPESSPTRVFLLRSASGTKMLAHAHAGVEMTCVLSGAFSQEDGRYGPGDFDFGDEAIHHQPQVEDGAECLCLVAMQGELRLSGLLGRLVQPFVRL